MRVVTIALGSMLLLGGTAGSAAGTISYAYDARGRLVQVIRVVNNGTPIVTAYTFDKADNRTGKTTTGSSNPPPP